MAVKVFEISKLDGGVVLGEKRYQAAIRPIVLILHNVHVHVGQ
jgi:hypothetical protein